MIEPAKFSRRVRRHLDALYPDSDTDALTTRVIAAIGIDIEAGGDPIDPLGRWSAEDTLLITYGDSIIDADRQPLEVLADVVAQLTPAISVVHVLPFYPYSSDRGFSVIDYTAVDPALGTWDDIARLGERVDLMADLVCNHISSESHWFDDFVNDAEPGRGYLMTAPADADVSSVVRPRALPLLHEVATASGAKHLWCTFSPDQVDLDYGNPDLLIEILGVIDTYLREGTRFIRLDAVAYLWKELGTSCIHLPQTHEMIRLWHTLLSLRAPEAVLVTETNVPNVENLSYFGNRDEAHMIYNFSLPPMVLSSLLNGNSAALSTWMMRMPPAPIGCTYLNFLSSHDGIGLRPAEGLLSDDEITDLVALTEARGGLHGTYDAPGGPRPYELNTSVWDLLARPADDTDDGLGEARFVCAHAIMFGVEGIPGVYVNSLFAQPNDRATADATGVRRDISRARLTWDEAQAILDGDDTPQARASSELMRLLEIRRQQPAFHPNATQFTLQLGDALFGFWRQSLDRTQSVFAVHNCTADVQPLPLHRLNLIATDSWFDLVSGRAIGLEPEWELGPYQTVWLTNRS